VRTGLYQEHLVLDKPLEIVGYDAQSAVQVVSAQRHALIVNADGVLLKRLRLVAGQSGGGTTSDLAVSALVVSRGRVEAEDCSFECHSENCVAVFGGTSLGVFKRCEIKGGRSVGLSSTHDARVVAEHCTIIEAGLAGASCSNGGQLRLSGSRVLQCRENGVLVYVEGTGSLRECEVARNGAAGIALKNGGRAEIDRCRINYNSGPGVLAQTGCAASVKGCNLSHNQRPWQADRGSTLIREANVE
jgi:F-box protein 11